MGSDLYELISHCIARCALVTWSSCTNSNQTLFNLCLRVCRTTASTLMNDTSSRSHAIFTIKFTHVSLQVCSACGLPCNISELDTLKFWLYAEKCSAPRVLEGLCIDSVLSRTVFVLTADLSFYQCALIYLPICHEEPLTTDILQSLNVLWDGNDISWCAILNGSSHIDCPLIKGKCVWMVLLVNPESFSKDRL